MLKSASILNRDGFFYIWKSKKLKMKNKIIIGLFAMVLAYGCSTKKSMVTDDSEVKEALGINNKTESSVNEMVESINKKPMIQKILQQRNGHQL